MPAVGPVRFVVVAASPILNVLPVVLPMPDFFTTPRSFLVTGGAMASRVLTANQRTGDISNHACQVLRNHEVGPKKPAVASFQVYVTWLQNLSFWFLILGYTLVVRYNRKRNECGDFPGGPIVKNLPDNAGDMGLIPSLRISNMLWGN